MRSSNEMYERGILDAEQDDLNLFYYQHYYYYRKGYDKARKRVKRAHGHIRLSPKYLVLLLVGGVVVSIAVWLISTNQIRISMLDFSALPDISASSNPTPTPGVTPRPTTTSTPTITVLTPTVTATIVPSPTLRIGGQAQVVNVGEVALLGRSEPDTDAPEQARFLEGTQVTIIDGPVEADGYRWWLVQDAEQNSGWSAESSLQGVPLLQPLPS